MRTNVEIDDELMQEAKAYGPYKTKKETIEAALRHLVRLKHLRELDEVRGPNFFFEGYDYKAMREAD